MFGRIILGLIGIGAGIFLAIYHNWIADNVGHIAWADNYLGSFGGTRTLYILLGILIIAISTLYMTGNLGPIIESIIGRTFGTK